MKPRGHAFWTGTRVLENLYEDMKDKPVTVDLTSLWKELGIQRSQNGDITFTDDAPLAAVRKSITAVAFMGSPQNR